MERAQQQSLFRTGKDRESKVRQIDRVNQQAARIILEQRQGGLMEEWARMILRQPSASVLAARVPDVPGSISATAPGLLSAPRSRVASV